MTYAQSHLLARNIHIAVAIYQFLYIYGPLHDWQYGLAVVQFIAFPLLLATGIWLRKGRKLWVMFTQQPAL